MKGDLAELLIYDKALTAEERATVLNYLGAKYGIAYVRLGNQAPVVNLTSPTDGATLALPATATIVANATDSDDTVVSVQLLANGLPARHPDQQPVPARRGLPLPRAGAAHRRRHRHLGAAALGAGDRTDHGHCPGVASQRRVEPLAQSRRRRDHRRRERGYRLGRPVRAG
ncbi:MAG: Ig-like domain-containing protein [Verrucomicrobia bacterium]|nr:Ig-like domain-containing protein [Verrucomicrobiota bacterium]